MGSSHFGQKNLSGSWLNRVHVSEYVLTVGNHNYIQETVLWLCILCKCPEPRFVLSTMDSWALMWFIYCQKPEVMTGSPLHPYNTTLLPFKLSHFSSLYSLISLAHAFLHHKQIINFQLFCPQLIILYWEYLVSIYGTHNSHFLYNIYLTITTLLLYIYIVIIKQMRKILTEIK